MKKVKRQRIVAKQSAVLPDEYIKALSLLSSTELTMREIAAQVGLNYDSLCDVYIGKNPKDQTTILFQAELKKIDTLIKDKVKRLTTENRLIVLEEINELLRQMRRDGDRDDRVLVSVLNALAKTTAGVEINAQIQNNTFNTMTTEELIHEYRRLTAITTARPGS
jgi:hypothetical protein